MPNYNQSASFLGTGQYQVQTQPVDENAARLSEQERYRRTLQQGADTAGNRPAASTTAATIATGPQDQARAAQLRLLGGLVGAAEGQGPSVAEQQFQQATDRNVRGAVAATNTARGMGGGAAVRQVAQTQAQVGQQAAADAATLRAQEVAQARGQAVQAATDVRGQDVALAGEQANLQQQANLANLQSEEGQRQLNQQAVQYYLSAGLSMEEANRQAAMDMERLKQQQNLAYNQLGQQEYDTSSARRSNFLQGLVNTGASLGMAFAGIPPAPKPA
jgi:hypothetical protein